MKIKSKRCFLLSIILILFLILISSVHSVGIRRFSYDIPEYEFKPGLEFTVEYEAIGLVRDAKIELSGQFAEYSTLSKTTIALSDLSKKFILNVEIPATANSEDFDPGTNGLRLEISDDLSGVNDNEMFILSTSATTPIRIHVPYPGDYAEFSDYNLPSVNSGLDTVVEFTIWNRGNNNHINAHYEFLVKNKEEIVLTKTKTKINIPSQEKKTFHIPIESNTFIPGNYNTTLTYYYASKTAVKEQKFKIGQLNLDIINYTRALFNDSIQKFDIAIRSDWNEIIKNVYADINLNGTTTKTTPTDLSNFQQKVITAYIDPSGVPSGNYSVDVTLFYMSETKTESFIVEVIERPITKNQIEINWLLMGLIILLVLLFIITIVFIIILKKPKNDKVNQKSINKKN
jgi:hypothetical protein